MTTQSGSDKGGAKGQLRQSIGLLDLVMLGASTAMGASVFSVLGPAAEISGSGMLITLALAVVPMAFFGLVYAFLASAMPCSGASFEWQRRFVHPSIGFAIGWLRVMGSALLMVTMGTVMVNYLNMIITIPVKTAVFVAFTLVFLLNLGGIAMAARAQTAMMILLLATFAIFVVSGVPHVSLANIGNPLDAGIVSIAAGLPLLIHLFLGIETATEVSGEVRNAKRVVPVALLLALLLTGLVYCLITFTALGTIGPRALGNSTAPLTAAAGPGLGTWAVTFIAVAAALALLKSMNAIFIVYVRFLYAMGRAGMLPERLGTVDPRGSPRAAIVAAYLGSSLALALPGNLIFLFLAINIPTMFKYFGTCLAAFNAVTRHTNILESADLALGKRQVQAFSVIGMVLAIAIAGLGFQTDWRPYALLGGWLALGLTGWGIAVRRRRLSAA